MKRRRARWMVIAVIVIAAINHHWWTIPKPPNARSAPSGAVIATGKPSTDDLAVERAALPEVERGDPAAATMASSPPATDALPPLDTALVDVLDDLERRSRAGDRRAACRLARDGVLCRNEKATPDSVAFLEADAATREPDEGTVAFIARIEEEAERAEKVCRGLPEGWADANTWRYMLQAARAGDANLATHFVVAPPMDESRFLEQPDLWLAYRDAAPGMLERAAAQGDPSAVYFLQRAYGGQPVVTGMPGAIPPDPDRAAVYAMVLSHFADASTTRDLQVVIDAARARLSADAMRALTEQAEQLRRERFANQKLVDFASGALGGHDAADCEKD